jgi:hypothetical protein
VTNLRISPFETGREPWLTTKRRGAPPFNRPVWAEFGKDYTVCGYCNTLLKAETGPVCPACRTTRRQAKAKRRRERRAA